MKNKKGINRKIVTMFALVVALGTAVYLNWRFSADNSVPVIPSSSGQDTQGEDGVVGGNYGDALFVSGSTDTAEYFASARLARTQSRDEALSALQQALQDTELSDVEKNELTAKLTAEARSISLESNVESLIKSKGFSDCVAYINSSSAKIVVAAPSQGLSETQVAQIMEIVLSQTELSASQVSIVEVK